LSPFASGEGFYNIPQFLFFLN